MNYELKSSIHKKKISFPFKIIFIVIIILLLLHFLIPRLLSNIFTTMIKPFWTINKDAEPDLEKFSNGLNNLISIELKEENDSLKEILNRKDDSEYVLGYILKKPPFTAYDSFILDIGTKNGIKLNDKVYVYGNILIGEIAEVSYSTSKVKLFSSYNTKYEVIIGKNNIQAVAIGRGGGNFETTVPRDVSVSEGDSITIPEISNSVFGIVGKVIADPARAFSTIIFSQPINIYEQKWVIVSLNRDL